MDDQQLIERIEAAVTASLKVEKSHGVPFDYLMALSNLSRELGPLKFEQPLEEVWRAYRVQTLLADYYRENPEAFPGFTMVEGESNLEQLAESGGVLLAAHFGDYRHGGYEAMRRLRALNSTLSISMVVDQESYNIEVAMNAWEVYRKEVNYDLLIADKKEVAIQILRQLKGGGVVLVYIDGNRGSGVDSAPTDTSFLTSTIRVRSGIFRLLSKSCKPAVSVVCTRFSDNAPRLICFPPIALSGENLSKDKEACFQHFLDHLRNQPHLWRFWFRHHEQVVSWKSSDTFQAEPSSHWFTQVDSITLNLEVPSGHVYQS